jgi:hypothetical protein
MVYTWILYIRVCASQEGQRKELTRRHEYAHAIPKFDAHFMWVIPKLGNWMSDMNWPCTKLSGLVPLDDTQISVREFLRPALHLK